MAFCQPGEFAFAGKQLASPGKNTNSNAIPNNIKICTNTKNPTNNATDNGPNSTSTTNTSYNDNAKET
jgi:hypothetical protein